MNSKNLRIVLAAATVATSLVYPAEANANWFKKHVVHLIHKPIPVVVKPVEHAVEQAVPNKAVVSPVVHVAVKEIALPVTHVVAESPAAILKDTETAAEKTYYGVSEGTHATFSGLRKADADTLEPLRNTLTKDVGSPAWQFINTPVAAAGGKVLGFADNRLAMKGSVIPGGAYFDKRLALVARRIDVSPEVLEMFDPANDARRIADQIAWDTPTLFHVVVRGTSDLVSLDPTRIVGAAADINEAGVALVSNSGMAAVRPIVITYAHGLMYQSANASDVAAPGVAAFDDNRLVFYVNGLDVSEPDAKSAASACSKQLNRPVKLIYNEGGGGTGRLVLSVAEATYDRIQNSVAVGPLRALNGDATTRRITGAIVDGAKNRRELTLIGHSQGTLEIAGAMKAAASLGYGEYIRNHVEVILAGTPLVESEIQPKPKAIHLLHNDHDAVADLIGGNLTNPDVPGQGHGFVSDYVKAIDPNWIGK